MNKKRVLRPLILLVVILALWQGASSVLAIPSYILPSPLELGQHMITSFQTGNLWHHIFTTLREILIGTFYGILLGIVLGYLIAKSTVVERLLMPIILIIQIAPKISLAPLFILWFGLGLTSKIALVILVVSFPVMVAQSTTIKNIDQNYVDFMTVLNGNKWQRFIHIELPYSLTAILSGIKVSVTQGMTGAVIGEMMGAQAGLGYLLTYGSEMYDIKIILSSVIILSFLGLILYYIAEFAESKIIYWK
ncbi:ABC transporter permease [Erysipelothrix sp. HDW6C]|uniref:ABC transporter permease n=1 Tax=Erysipelothrix sp. HDW6C TaxID=2714930 RepID=UPI0014084297|nr:ABC transporter permease [Erysipelothrix sp. HDW6C]QIK69529.1 ABC transporter permease [Erysipelothrix sp. HDW6C]